MSLLKEKGGYVPAIRIVETFVSLCVEVKFSG